jgi:hypothetical protein
MVRGEFNRSRRLALVLAAAFGAAACASATRSDGTEPASTVATVMRTDSCDTLPLFAVSRVGDTGAVPPPPPVTPGTLRSVRQFLGSDFSIRVPVAASVTARGSERFTSILSFRGFPDCRECSIEVRIFPDSSGGGADGHVAELLRWTAVADSINNDPRTTVYQLTDYRGPARPVIVGGNRGIWLNGDCGDCWSESLFFSEGGRIAHVSFTMDAYEPEGRRHACRLARLAETFRWRRRF